MIQSDHPALVLVGNPAEIHMGSHLLRSAQSLKLSTLLVNSAAAYEGSWLTRKINWHLRKHRPTQLRLFSQAVLNHCLLHRPTWLLSTGIAPLTGEALERIRTLGTTCVNYLTDDPWNPHHRASWFLDALPQYDQVFSPRRANLNDIESVGCKKVAYLPFGYFPELHRPDASADATDNHLACDVLFVGGADSDRVPWIGELIHAKFDVALYGGYWEQYKLTRPYGRGHTDIATMRTATGAAKISLCLVRKANRDGHVMRTFEIAAMRGCMLAEDTPEHREIIGEEGENAFYFNSPQEMVTKSRWLLDHPDERQGLANRLHERITRGRNTYCDRLMTMLGLETESAAENPIHEATGTIR